jgi:fructose-bisphosphate aldolase class I
VPIVEPEIMLDGNHTFETARRVHEKVWEAQYHALNQYGVLLEGSLFKPSMIVPGADIAKESPEKVAQATVDTLLKTVPAAMPGVTFLSGGQSEEEATVHINAMNVYRTSPWALTFSFGRALQASVLKKWGGKDENKKEAQSMLRAIAQVNGMAAMGKYSKEQGHPSVTGSLYVKDYKY